MKEQNDKSILSGENVENLVLLPELERYHHVKMKYFTQYSNRRCLLPREDADKEVQANSLVAGSNLAKK